MSDPIKRRETTYIDEATRTATSTLQWFLEKPNRAGLAQPPVTHNNRLALFMCGQESFADIAAQIVAARESIDICCWGFDPGMELVRKPGFWPRGDTYGDLLIAAGRRGVKVRLLVWYDVTAVNTKNPRNMPGHTHDYDLLGPSYRQNKAYAANLHAKTCVAMVQAQFDDPIKFKFMMEDFIMVKRLEQFPRGGELVAIMAREEYCGRWYQAAFAGLLEGIEIRTRSGDADAVVKTLAGERHRPDATSAERNALVHFPTHHQKPILIDFNHADGVKAVGYVMGLNSLTDYWDTPAHKLEDVLRENNGERDAIDFKRDKRADPGFRSYLPYHDYACRIEGRALVSLYNNFVKAWERVDPAGDQAYRKSELGSRGMPEAMLRRAEPGDCSVQIVRTQPEEGETSIRDIYRQATDMATLAGGYLYVENQYFQHEEWAQRLLETREKVITAWKAGCAKAGKTMDDIPIMHVFVVIPVPEMANMIPRTYDTLATLGQQEAMTGQCAMIDEANKPGAVNLTPAWRDVLQHANRIEKPTPKTMEDKFGLRVCTAMLNSCGVVDGRWRYREVYIHSKLLLVDDCFLTLGSANLNMRSMAVDSEINIATCAPTLARDLRQRVWAQHSGNADGCDGGSGTRGEIANTFKNWTELMGDNKSKKKRGQKMTGFLLPLEDSRSSFVRLG